VLLLRDQPLALLGVVPEAGLELGLLDGAQRLRLLGEVKDSP
jgi:hypothetical protein